MFLLFNMLSRFVIAFLPMSKCLLISWVKSPSTVILEPKKIKSVTGRCLILTILSFIQHMLNKELRWVIQRLCKSLFFLYISFPENHWLLEEKHILLFTQVSTTLSTEPHTLTALKKHQSHESIKKGSCQTREGMRWPGSDLHLYLSMCLKNLDAI